MRPARPLLLCTPRVPARPCEAGAAAGSRPARRERKGGVWIRGSARSGRRSGERRGSAGTRSSPRRTAGGTGSRRASERSDGKARPRDEKARLAASGEPGAMRPGPGTPASLQEPFHSSPDSSERAPWRHVRSSNPGWYRTTPWRLPPMLGGRARRPWRSRSAFEPASSANLWKSFHKSFLSARWTDFDETRAFRGKSTASSSR